MNFFGVESGHRYAVFPCGGGSVGSLRFTHGYGCGAAPRRTAAATLRDCKKSKTISTVTREEWERDQMRALQLWLYYSWLAITEEKIRRQFQ